MAAYVTLGSDLTHHTNLTHGPSLVSFLGALSLKVHTTVLILQIQKSMSPDMSNFLILSFPTPLYLVSFLGCGGTVSLKFLFFDSQFPYGWEGCKDLGQLYYFLGVEVVPN